MAADFRLIYAPDDAIVVPCTKDTAVVIEPGDMVTLSSGLIIKATEASTALGFCPVGGGTGITSVGVISDDRCIFEGTADAAFAVTDKGAKVDMVIDTGAQKIDLGESTTDVFKVDFSENAGTATSTANVRVRINKTL